VVRSKGGVLGYNEERKSIVNRQVYLNSIFVELIIGIKHLVTQVSVSSIQQAFTAISRSVSGLSKCLEICTILIIFGKHGPLTNNLLIHALHYFRSR
jgi:hypothetical protein